MIACCLRSAFFFAYIFEKGKKVISHIIINVLTNMYSSRLYMRTLYISCSDFISLDINFANSYFIINFSNIYMRHLYNVKTFNWVTDFTYINLNFDM